MKKLRFATLVALVLAALMVLAACGEDKKEASGSGNSGSFFGDKTGDKTDTQQGSDNKPEDKPGKPDTSDVSGGSDDTPISGTDKPADDVVTPVQPCAEHKYEAAEKVERTCTEDGSIKYVCKVCKAEKQEAIYAAHIVENNKCILCNLEAATDLEFVPTDDGTGMMLVGVGSNSGEDVIVPSHVSGLPVVKVSGAVKISRQTNLKKVIKIYLPDTVTVIDTSAFSSGSLESIYIPDSVTEIGNSAFEACSSLPRLHIPESVSVIGEAALSGCYMLWEYRIPDAVTVFSDEMLKRTPVKFEYLGDLSRVTYFGNYFVDFSYCNEEFGVLVLPENATLANYAFAAAKAEEIVLPPNLTEIPEGLFSHSSIQRVTIPATVKELGYGCFMNCKNLTSVVIPEGVTQIDSRAFEGCTALTEIILPSTLEVIGNNAFEGCINLTSINLPESLEIIGMDAFKDSGIKN